MMPEFVGTLTWDDLFPEGMGAVSFISPIDGEPQVGYLHEPPDPEGLCVETERGEFWRVINAN